MFLHEVKSTSCLHHFLNRKTVSGPRHTIFLESTHTTTHKSRLTTHHTTPSLVHHSNRKLIPAATLYQVPQTYVSPRLTTHRNTQILRRFHTITHTATHKSQLMPPQHSAYRNQLIQFPLKHTTTYPCTLLIQTHTIPLHTFILHRIHSSDYVGVSPIECPLLASVCMYSSGLPLRVHDCRNGFVGVILPCHRPDLSLEGRGHRQHTTPSQNHRNDNHNTHTATLHPRHTLVTTSIHLAQHQLISPSHYSSSRQRLPKSPQSYNLGKLS
jgi:hypothetical protein